MCVCVYVCVYVCKHMNMLYVSAHKPPAANKSREYDDVGLFVCVRFVRTHVRIHK
jgi:hypothetical protein